MTSNSDVTPLMLACQNNNAEEVAVHIASGLTPNTVDSSQRTALFYCAENTDTTCIQLLKKANVNLNQQDKDGLSCLHVAVMCGNGPIVDYLIRNGADVNITDAEMHSVVHFSVVCGQLSLFEMLLSSQADPETADIHGAYPIHYAAQMCGKVDSIDEQQQQPRDAYKSLLILKRLIEQKVKVNAEDFDQRNALIWAASSGADEAVVELFKAGSDSNKHEKDGLTALHCAASRGHLNCIQLLVDLCKCSVDIMDNNNCTPIFYAATLGQDKACSLLIKMGANLHVQDVKGRTVYHCAAGKGQLKCLKILCEKERNIWVRNRRGDFAIQEAYYNKQYECVNYLLDTISNNQAYEASNLYDNRTLLHLAASENNLKFCKKLVESGCVEVNPLMKSSNNTLLTPYDLAKLKKASDCEKYLKSMGGCSASECAKRPPTKINNNNNAAKNKQTNEKTNSKEDNKNNNINNNNENKKKKENNNSNSKNGKKVGVAAAEVFFEPQRQFINKSAQTMIASTKQKLIMVDSSNESFASKKNDNTNIKNNNGKLNSTNRTTQADGDNNTNKLLLQRENAKRFEEEEVSPIYDDSNDSEEKYNKLDITNESIEIEPEPIQQQTVVVSKLKKKNSFERNKNEDSRIKQQEEQRPQQLAEVSKLKKQNSFESNNNEDSRIKQQEQRPQKPQKVAQDNRKLNAKILAEPSVAEKKQNNLVKSVSNESVAGAARKVMTTHKLIQKTLTHKDEFKVSDETFEASNNNNINNNNNNRNIKFDNKSVGTKPEKLNKTSKNITSNVNRKKLNLNDSVNNSTNSATAAGGEETNVVKLVIKGDNDELDNLDVYNSNGVLYSPLKRQPSTFEQQRLILKSLYEIRRNRINNRNIVISSELNNLLLKNYNFDITKNCKSLKDLERTLEVYALEISEEYKKQQKNRSQTLLTIKQKNKEHSKSRSNENLKRSSSKSKTHFSRRANFNLTPPESNINETTRSRSERFERDLKIAYKSRLPNDIYRQYYSNSKSKTMGDKILVKGQSPREKSIFLPVITQKPGFST